MRCSFSCRPHDPCLRAGCPHDVQIGVGNVAGRDMDMEASGNNVRGHGRVRLGVDNYAGRDSNLEVIKNDIKNGHGETKMGVGNEAGRDSRIVISRNWVSPY